MSQAFNPAIDERGAIKEPTRRGSRLASRETGNTSKESFLNHYLSRVSPEVASSFTQDQRDAMMIMFGAREIANHSIEVRRSIPFGRRRFYMIFLVGPERRDFVRLHNQGAVSRRFNILFYLGVGALLLAPVLALLYGTWM